MWKYIYISLVGIALLAAAASAVVNQKESVSGVKSLMQRLGMVSKEKEAAQIMGLRMAQQAHIERMDAQIDRQYRELMEKQARMREQLLDINNQADMSFSEFTSLLSEQMGEMERRARDADGYGSIALYNELDSLNEMMNHVRTQAAGNSWPPRDQISHYIGRIEQKVNTVSEYVDPDTSLQYQQELTKLRRLSEQQARAQEEIRDQRQDLRLLQEQLRRQREDMLAKQEQLTAHNDYIMEQNRNKLATEQNDVYESLSQQGFQQAQFESRLEKARDQIRDQKEDIARQQAYNDQMQQRNREQLRRQQEIRQLIDRSY